MRPGRDEYQPQGTPGRPGRAAAGSGLLAQCARMLPTHPVSRQVAHVAGSLHGASHRWRRQRRMQLAQAQPASVGRSLLAPPHTQQPAAAASSESAGGALFATPVLSEYDSPAGAQPAHQRHSRTQSGENRVVPRALWRLARSLGFGLIRY